MVYIQRYICLSMTKKSAGICDDLGCTQITSFSREIPLFQRMGSMLAGSKTPTIFLQITPAARIRIFARRPKMSRLNGSTAEW